MKLSGNQMIAGILESALEYAKSAEFQRRVQVTLLDPVLHYLLERMYPYILAVAAIFFLTFVFVALILILIVHSLFWKH